MIIKLQARSLYTLIKHETERMFRIYSQVFFPPIITTLLYFFIFGAVMGDRIGSIQDVSYIKFIAPGLIMISVITNSYANVVSSLYTARFQRSIEEILISPLFNSLLLFGFVFGGIIRGLIISVLVFIISSFFVKLSFASLPMILLAVLLISSIFALAGFINGILAKNFDQISIVPTFILTPLNYFGGVFYSIQMLPVFWQHMTYCNPIFYMVDLLRYIMLGSSQVNIYLSLSIVISILVALIITNMILLRKGIGLRQ